MKILFFVEELLDDTNPTVKIARLIAKEWLGAGHEVVFLCNDQGAKKKLGSRWCEAWENFKTYRYLEPYTIYWKELKTSGTSKITALLRHPRLLFSYLDMMSGFRKNTAKKISRYIDEIAESERVDVVYCITEPYMSALALAYAKTSVKKRVYMGDPFSFAVNRNYNDKSLKQAREMERFVLSKVEKVFVTDLAKKQYEEDSLFRDLTDKLGVVEFPNVRPINIGESDNITEKYLVSGKINCVFAGRFYEDIRRPEFLLDTFAEIKSNDVILHIFGGGMEGVVKKYLIDCRDKIVIHDFLPENQLMQVLNKADVLVSLNNTAKNQVPSKIFEFFSLGKPVLNMCYLNDCPTLPYADKYPICENVFLQDGVKVNSEKVFDFVINSRGQSIEYSEVEELFVTSTPRYVAEELLR